MAPSEAEAFRKALKTNPAEVERALVAFDANTAQATMEVDKLSIMAYIQEVYANDDDHEEQGPGDGHRLATGANGAIERFNKAVRAAIKVALASTSWDIGMLK